MASCQVLRGVITVYTVFQKWRRNTNWYDFTLTAYWLSIGTNFDDLKWPWTTATHLFTRYRFNFEARCVKLNGNRPKLIQSEAKDIPAYIFFLRCTKYKSYTGVTPWRGIKMCKVSNFQAFVLTMPWKMIIGEFSPLIGPGTPVS